MLPATITTLDGVDPIIAKEYVKGTGIMEGKWVLEVGPSDGLSLDNVEGMKATMTTLRAEKNTSDAALKAFGDLDPIVAQSAIDQIAELGDGSDNAAKIKAAETQLRTKFDTDLAAVKLKFDTDSQAQGLKYDGIRGQLDKQLTQTQATAEILAAGGNPKILLPLIMQNIAMRETAADSGQFEVIVNDALGNLRLSTESGSTENMSVTQLVAELRKDVDLQVAFNPDNSASGVGSNTSNNNANNNASRGDGETLLPEYTMTEQQASDPEHYQRVKAAAIEAGQPFGMAETA